MKIEITLHTQRHIHPRRHSFRLNELEMAHDDRRHSA